MTTSDEATRVADEPDEDLELSKDTIEDLDPPEETAEAAKGGVSRGCKL
jgi:hypothetical protein